MNGDGIAWYINDIPQESFLRVETREDFGNGDPHGAPLGTVPARRARDGVLLFIKLTHPGYRREFLLAERAEILHNFDILFRQFAKVYDLINTVDELRPHIRT